MNIEFPIKIDNLSFSFGDKPILKDINFKIKKGDFCSIIGPNGSGKTTLLKNICRNLDVNKNRIFVNEKDLISYSNKSLAKNLSLVPQNTNIDFDFSAFDIVLMGRSPYLRRFQSESEEDLSIVEKAMNETNTWHLKDKNISQLSGGERQRVIAARSIAQGTDILLLDEPIAHLDIHHQIELLDTVKKLNKSKNITVIAVLHDLNLAAQYSNKLILLNSGKVVEVGNPEEVLTFENIKNIYDMNFQIIKNPITGKPHILPISKI